MRYAVAAVALALGASCLAGPALATTAADPAAACAALADVTVGADAIGLPTSGATVTSATLVAARTVQPEFCKVLARIDPVSSSAVPILLEVNLPTDWNDATLQEGGAGYEGTLVSGLGTTPVLFPVIGGDPRTTPLQRGYVTFGSNGGVPAGGRGGLDDEERANFDGDAVKKTRDVAIALVQQYYGRLPAEQYVGGASKGGQEALVAAQRYPEDYDGVIAVAPSLSLAGLVVNGYRMEQAAYAEGGNLDAAQQRLLRHAVQDACDGLDGVSDGIVADTGGCASTFDVATLRCPGGVAAGDGCLDDAQVAALRGAAAAYTFAFPLANDLTTVGGFPVLTGAPLGAGVWGDWWMSASGTDDSLLRALTTPYLRYFVAGDASAPTTEWDYTAHQDRLQQLSASYDVSSPDLDAFLAHGGRLVLVQGSDDMVVPASLTTRYYRRLVDRYGSTVTDAVRYYRQPGYGHAAGTFDLSFDALGALDSWVRTGTPPADQVATDVATDRTLPLCDFPRWPRYVGSGPIDEASSYRCASTAVHPRSSTTTLHLAPTARRGVRPLLVVRVSPSARAGGSVTVRVDGSVLVRRLRLGRVQLRLPALAPGRHRVRVRYAGTPSLGASSAVASYRVTRR